MSMNYVKERISSDRGDSMTVSQMLWITFTVVLVIMVGQKVYTSIKKKSDQMADCIDKSDVIFSGTGGTSNCGGSGGTTP